MPAAAGLLGNTRPNRGEFGETVNWLVASPADPAQDQKTIKGIVEGPRVVAEDADEDFSFAVLAGPEG